MIEVAFSSSFQRSLAKVLRKDAARRERFESVLLLFIQDPFTSSLKTHKLSGRMKDHWSFTIEYDLRVVFKFVEPNKALFEDIGTHDDVYS